MSTGRATATVVVGAQWGDEGKGKIVDLLAESFAVVARYQGGNNAGHTVQVGDETFKFRLLPSGILFPGKLCVLGNGVVLDPEVLCEELDELAARGRSAEGLRISGNAHLVMPWHRVLDQASELHLGALAIGTTRRGIGPAYADKAARVGIRVQDLLDAKILREKIATALELKNEQLGFLYGIGRLDAGCDPGLGRALRRAPRAVHRRRLAARQRGARPRRGRALRGRPGHAARSRPRHLSVRDVVEPDRGLRLRRARHRADAGRRGRRRRQGLSHARGRGARSRARPSPTAAEALREAGGEFGTVTGRPRRCGWLDLVGLRYAARVNGFTELVLTKLDVLSGATEIPVCVAYRLRDGSVSEHFPAHQSDFHHAEPVWETLEGWSEPIDGARHFADLPPAAQRYVAFVAERLGIPVGLVSVGPRRDQVLTADASTTAARALAST